MSSLDAFIAGLPKAELHVHIEGTLEPQMVRRIAERNGLPVPPSSVARTEGYAFHDLTSFLAVYYPNMAILQTVQDFDDLAWAYLQKVRQENVVHVEMFFDPQAHTSRGVPFHVFMSGFRNAIVRAERELDMTVLMIMCFVRDMDPGFAMATLMESLQYRSWIVGVGLDSDERGNPPNKFAQVFARARKEGYLLTAHCDIDQQDSIEHIRQVVEDIQVDRIDHGTNIVESATLIEMVRGRRIGLTCCPVSNSVVTSDFKGSEIMSLLRKGVKVTVNSDDPAYFRAYMNGNLRKMMEGADVTRADLATFQKNAFEIAWISSARRQQLLDQLDVYMSN